MPALTFPLLTKTLLFLNAPDRGGHYLNAIDKETGEFVHKVPIPYSYAAPMTYLAEGRQYIVFATGQGNETGLMALALRSDRAAAEGAIAPRSVLTSREPGDIYAAVCARCHDEAIEGAPRPGHAGDWELRLGEGTERIVARTIAGMPPHMPARGLCDECTDEELEAVVDLMLEDVVATQDDAVKGEHPVGRASPVMGQCIGVARECASILETRPKGAPSPT